MVLVIVGVWCMLLEWSWYVGVAGGCLSKVLVLLVVWLTLVEWSWYGLVLGAFLFLGKSERYFIRTVNLSSGKKMLLEFS